jgi:hypothetical protein
MEVGLYVARGDDHAARVYHPGLGSEGPLSLANVGNAPAGDSEVCSMQLSGVDVCDRAPTHEEIRGTLAARRLD